MRVIRRGLAVVIVMIQVVDSSSSTCSAWIGLALVDIAVSSGGTQAAVACAGNCMLECG